MLDFLSYLQGNCFWQHLCVCSFSSLFFKLSCPPPQQNCPFSQLVPRQSWRGGQLPQGSLQQILLHMENFSFFLNKQFSNYYVSLAFFRALEYLILTSNFLLLLLEGRQLHTQIPEVLILWILNKYLISFHSLQFVKA